MEMFSLSVVNRRNGGILSGTVISLSILSLAFLCAIQESNIMKHMVSDAFGSDCILNYYLIIGDQWRRHFFSVVSVPTFYGFLIFIIFVVVIVVLFVYIKPELGCWRQMNLVLMWCVCTGTFVCLFVCLLVIIPAPNFHCVLHRARQVNTCVVVIGEKDFAVLAWVLNWNTVCNGLLWPVIFITWITFVNAFVWFRICLLCVGCLFPLKW